MEWVTALAITGVAIALQLTFVIHAGGLWRDEVNSVETASAASWSELWRRLEFESFPAGWILFLRSWIQVAGASDSALRIAGLLGSVALVGAIWLAMRRLGRTVPLVSLALLAINPEVIRWSGSVRAWGAAAALALVAIVLLYEATRRPSRWRVILAAAVCAASVQCAYQNATVLVAVAMSAALPALRSRDWRRASVPMGIGAAALASLLPYAGTILRRRGWDGLNQVPLSAADLGARFLDVLAASGPLATIAWSALLAALVFALLSGRMRERDRYAAAVLALSIALTATFYLYFHYPTRPWYFLSLVTVAAVCGELVVVERSIWMTRARVIVALVVVIAGLSPGFAGVTVPQTNMPAVAAAIAARASAGDLVIASPWYLGISLSRYYRGPAAIRTIPPLADVHVHRYDLVKGAMLDASALEPLLAEFQRVLTCGQRIWIVGPAEARMPTIPHTQLPAPPLERTGWLSTPYEWSWMCQTGSFLARHGADSTPIELPERGGPYEDVSLLLVAGWR